MIKKFALLLLLNLCAVLAVHAAQLPRWWKLNSILFQNLTTESGLPHPVIQAISQDGEGFIWVGTQGGLARWDGYQFRNYLPLPNDLNSLPDNYIQALYTDKKGQLWIGTNNGGLARYDKSTDSFTRISIWGPGEHSAAIFSICSDGRDGLWIGTFDGLVHLKSDLTRTHLVHERQNISSIPDNQIRAVFVDRTGLLWVGTQKGLVTLDEHTGQFSGVPLQNQTQNPIVRSIIQSADGQIWVGSSGAGAYVIDPETRTSKQVIEPESGEINLSHVLVAFITEIVPGQVWVGTSHGIVMVDVKTMTTRRLLHDSAIASSLNKDICLSVFRDSSGLVWVGTENGISRYDSRQTAMLSVLGDANYPNVFGDIDVSGAMNMDNGNIWLGLRNNGVGIIDGSANEMSRLGVDRHHPFIKASQPGMAGFSALFNGKPFLATEHGIFSYDVSGSLFRHLSFPPLNPLTPVNSLHLHGQKMWVGAENGLWVIDLSNQSARPEARREPGTALLDNEIVETVVFRDDKLWIGTRTRGLYRLDPASHTLQHYDENAASSLSSAVISSLLFDHSGRLWISTFGQGVFMNDNPGTASGFHLRHFGIEQGMPSSLADTVLEDPDGNIWVSTDDGLAVINAEALTVRPIKKSSTTPVLPGYWAHSGLVTTKGEIIFGGIGGLTVILPELLTSPPYSPPLVITNITVGGKSAAVTFDAGHAYSPVLIDPEANSIAVEFSALDYSSPKQNRYAYQLDGFDKVWLETSSVQRVAAYTNLPPGDYTLHLKGSNSSGIWNEHQLLLPIKVLPAWYQTWWFHLVQALLATLTIYGLIQIRTRYLRKRQQQLMAEVKQRTNELNLKHAELSQAYQQLSGAMESLKITQQQLVFREKMASIGSLTAGVAHEINNPVNFAHAGVQLLDSELEKFRSFLLKLAGDSTDAAILATINQHIDELKNKTAIVQDGTTRIRDLIKDLQVFSRVGEADRKTVSIRESLLSTVNLVRVQYEKIATIECRLNADPLLECWPAQLNQVFMNLIVNGCHAIEEQQRRTGDFSTGTITIQSRIEHDRLVLEFTDNGCGIEPGNLDRIFDPFFTTKETGQGTGLGLSISFRIIENHQGTISVISTPGKGSCFTIQLPLSIREAE